jgi:HEAT repeat protein
MSRCLLTLFACLFLGVSPSLIYAEPKIPKESIPANIPSEVRKQIERLYSEDSVDRGSAAFNLRKMGADAVPAIPFLIANLADEGTGCSPSCNHSHVPSGHTHVSPGEEAEKTLIELGKYAVEPLIAVVSDRNPEIRRRVVRILGLTKDPRAVNPLIATLRDENRNIRMLAAWSLAQIGEPSVDPLLGVLREQKSTARGDAAWALGNIKSPKSVEPLIVALGEGDPELKKDTLQALRRISGMEYGPDPMQWREWWEQNKAGRS